MVNNAMDVISTLQQKVVFYLSILSIVDLVTLFFLRLLLWTKLEQQIATGSSPMEAINVVFTKNNRLTDWNIKISELNKFKIGYKDSASGLNCLLVSQVSQRLHSHSHQGVQHSSEVQGCII
jgi:hypothetical protein